VDKLKKVEAEIVQTDLQIVRLRRQKEQLERAQAVPKPDEDQENVCETKQLSIAKLVYHENRAKAQKAHAKLEYLGGTSELPIYNQPSDNLIYHQNTARFSDSFKSSLINLFRSKLKARLKLEESVSTEYDRRMEKWLKSIESEDSQPTKRMKDAKTREFFEKQFPELKKARESGERFSRVGQRIARSDAEVAELLDGITEREDQDKKVKSYAVIPPMLEEMRSKKPKFINNNGYVEDIMAEYKEYQIMNTWTDEEKDIFRENYLQHPKNFGLISRMTNRKNVANCVQYYYLSKKSENYKQLLKRQQKRRTRSFVRPAANVTTNQEFVNDSNKIFPSTNTDQSQVGDSAMVDPGEQNNDVKLSTTGDPMLVKREISDPNQDGGNSRGGKDTCCICDCTFSDTNQFRNVTRSNHQLYGIGLDALRPDMKICYPCRFRHVRHPNFDEPNGDSEQMDCENEIDQQQNQNEMIAIKIPQESEQAPNEIETSHSGKSLTNKANSSLNQIDRIFPAGDPAQAAAVQANNSNNSQTNNLDQPNKGTQQRTYVRDIIYQVIEMSFQKPSETSTDSNGPPINQQPKQEPAQAQAQAQNSGPIAGGNNANNSKPSKDETIKQEPLLQQDSSTNREDSRSPSEMVIDESADVI